MRQNPSIDELRRQISRIEDGDTIVLESTCLDCESSNKHDEEMKRAMAKVARLVKASDKSVAKIRARLNRDGFEDQVIDSTVERAVEIGLLDDARYADVLIRSRVSQGKGIAGIERELRENGIEPISVAGWPTDYIDTNAEFDRAYDYLVRHPPRSKNVREGAFRKLVSKGYPSSIASSVARVWCDEQRERIN